MPSSTTCASRGSRREHRGAAHDRSGDRVATRVVECGQRAHCLDGDAPVAIAERGLDRCAVRGGDGPLREAGDRDCAGLGVVVARARDERVRDRVDQRAIGAAVVARARHRVGRRVAELDVGGARRVDQRALAADPRELAAAEATERERGLLGVWTAQRVDERGRRLDIAGAADRLDHDGAVRAGVRHRGDERARHDEPALVRVRHVIALERRHHAERRGGRRHHLGIGAGDELEQRRARAIAAGAAEAADRESLAGPCERDELVDAGAALRLELRDAQADRRVVDRVRCLRRWTREQEQGCTRGQAHRRAF